MTQRDGSQHVNLDFHTKFVWLSTNLRVKIAIHEEINNFSRNEAGHPLWCVERVDSSKKWPSHWLRPALLIIIIYIQAFQLEIVDFHTGLSECGDFGQNWSRS